MSGLLSYPFCQDDYPADFRICMGVTWGSVGLILEVDSTNTLRGTSW
jgi:hypothetical protein